MPGPCHHGFVYLLEAENGRIKIGFSATPDTRVEQIGASSPIAVRLIAKWVGTRDDEAALLAQFDAFRAYREWFFPASAVADFVAEKRGEGVLGPIAEWPKAYHTERSERKARGEASRVAKLRAMFADPEYREWRKSLLAGYRQNRAPTPSEAEARQ